MKASFTDGLATTALFEVTNGVKQCCVLAPTMFPIFLSAVLEDAFGGMDEDVYIQSRQDADLFNAAHLKARTKRTKSIVFLVRELLFSDNSALLAHLSEAIQRIVTAFSEASKRFGLKINIKTTEVLYQPNSFRT